MVNVVPPAFGPLFSHSVTSSARVLRPKGSLPFGLRRVSTPTEHVLHTSIHRVIDRYNAVLSQRILQTHLFNHADPMVAI
jgi:hypothetical protein